MVLHITPWERHVLEQLATGVATPEIAHRLGINERDVESHLNTLFARMGVTTTTEAVAVAMRRGLVAA